MPRCCHVGSGWAAALMTAAAFGIADQEAAVSQANTFGSCSASVSSPTSLGLLADAVTIAPVLRREWRPSDSIDDLMLGPGARPLILNGTPATSWGILKWTPEYLADAAASLVVPARVSQGKKEFLYYDVGGVQARFPGWTPTHSTQIMGFPEFFERMERAATQAETVDGGADGLPKRKSHKKKHQSKPAEYLQFSSSLFVPQMTAALPLAEDLPDASALMQLVVSDQSMVVGSGSRDSPPRKGAPPGWPGHVNALLWAGSANATTTLHYDTAHNSYLQLYGAKRFLLLPPHMVQKTPMFPEAHPSLRQSSVPLSALPSMAVRLGSNLDEGGKLEVAEAVLEPGELLLLPAHWMHHVEAVGQAPPSLSLSVNFWVKSAAEHAVQEVLSDPFPWEPVAPVSRTQSRNWVLACVCMFLSRAACGTLEMNGDGQCLSTAHNDLVRGWIERLLKRKYAALYELSSMPPYPCPPKDEAVGGAKVIAAIEHRATKVASLIREHVEPSLREEYLGHIAEIYVRNSAGGPTAVPAFLRDCV